MELVRFDFPKLITDDSPKIFDWRQVKGLITEGEGGGEHAAMSLAISCSTTESQQKTAKKTFIDN